MANMIVFVMVVITILFFIKIGMGGKKNKKTKNPNDNYVVGLASDEYINFRKEFNKLVKEFGNLSKEEQRNRLINHINEANRMERIDSYIAIDIVYLIITNLKIGRDVEIAKQVLLEFEEVSCKKCGINTKIMYLERNIKDYQEKGETEIANIYKEILLHFQELKRRLAEEGCFEIFENIEYYEYRTRYGATNYEKIGEGKLYITNQRLYFITDINAFHLVWLNNIMDINWYFLEDENKFQLKITRDGNAIFLESYDEVDIYKMYSYIKIIMENK